MSDAPPTARVAELLMRGPAPSPARGRRLRSRLRSILLRLARPYAAYQHEVNGAILSTLQALEGEDRRLSELVARQERQLHVLADRVGRHDEQFEALQPLIDDLVAAVENLNARTGNLKSVESEVAQWRTVPYLAGDPFDRFSASVGEVTGFRKTGLGVDADSPYVGFEDIFRGPADRVRELQRPYIALVADHQPILDIGCGRGEFLALLAEQGVAAHGIDTDPGMVRRCLSQGLSVELADANAYLEWIEDASLGTVFCAQVIEHVPIDGLQRMLKLARRKLVPGGLFIAETVNPHSIPAFKTFWVDLTHQHPIFPEVALAMCGLAGFESAYVFAPGHDDFERVRFRSNSYSVVATAPETQSN